MTYFADLGPYPPAEPLDPDVLAYLIEEGEEDLDAEVVWADLRTVGWLEPEHRFPTGPVDPAFVSLLGWLVTHRQVVGTRGAHSCRLPGCAPEQRPAGTRVLIDGASVLLGRAEVRVGATEGTGYAAPTLIHHYVTAHGYQPPAEFVAAVLAERPTRGH
ncbi:hypothetical protein AB0M43_28070 [Longispora sp. NPDC051575]|uniref:DUF7919 family protein n=1 Tax=Longispora sp. NPDC051575 TaxID=3154943 RepID=UPI00341A9F41